MAESDFHDGANPDAGQPKRACRGVGKYTRALVLLIIGALLIGGVQGFRYLWLSRPVGVGPAGPAVPKGAFCEPWTKRKVLLVGIGDSITAGYGASSGHSYFERIVGNPDDEWSDMRGVCLSAVLPNLEVKNLAVSGSTSVEHVDIIRDRLPIQPLDTTGLVVMTTGGNDIIHDYGRSAPREGAMYGATLEDARPWIESFGGRLDKMADLLEERFPGGCHIFVADIYDPTDGSGTARVIGLPSWRDGSSIHRAYNEVIRRFAAERKSVHLVPIREGFLGHGLQCRQFWRARYRAEDPYYWYANNFEDPNDRGYDAIRRAFLIEIAKVAPALRR